MAKHTHAQPRDAIAPLRNAPCCTAAQGLQAPALFCKGVLPHLCVQVLQRGEEGLQHQVDGLPLEQPPAALVHDLEQVAASAELQNDDHAVVLLRRRGPSEMSWHNVKCLRIVEHKIVPKKKHACKILSA